MKAGAGKNKGSKFEREIARTLTQYFTGKKSPEVFWRTAGSGGMATIARKQKREAKMHGDIMSIDERFNIVTDKIFIECKFHRKHEMGKCIIGKGKLFEWIIKAKKESKEAGKCMMILFKENLGGIFVCIDMNLHNKLTETINYPQVYVYYSLPEFKVYVYPFYEFMRWIPALNLLKILRKE